jgi:hypothetical protein
MLKHNYFQNSVTKSRIVTFCEDSVPEFSTLPSLTDLPSFSCKIVLYYVFQIREAISAFLTHFPYSEKNKCRLSPA